MNFQFGHTWGLLNTVELPDAIARYDASDADSITSSGGDVSGWADLGDGGYDVAQGNPSLQPVTGVKTIGGLNAIWFDDDANRTLYRDDYPVPASGDFSVFIVAQVLDDGSAGGNDSLVSIDSGGNDFQLCAGGTNFTGRLLSGSCDTIECSGGPFAGSDRLFNVVFDWTGEQKVKVYVDGVLRGENTYNAKLGTVSQIFRLGINRGNNKVAHCWIGEVWVLEDCTEATRLVMEAHLNEKWSL